MTFHSRTVPLYRPPARVRPSGLNATEYTAPDGPASGVPIWVGWAATLTFHSLIVPSALPAARVCPSGLNASDQTDQTRMRGCQMSGRRPIWVGWAGSLTFHSRIVLSKKPTARVSPSGLNATESTRVDPVRGCPS